MAQLKKPKIQMFGSMEKLVKKLRDTHPDAVPSKEELQFYKKLGVWAFCSFSGTGYAEIFMWVGPKAKPHMVAYVLGHELGHMSGTPLLYPWEEEPRADTYGRVVQLTMELMSDIGIK